MSITIPKHLSRVVLKGKIVINGIMSGFDKPIHERQRDEGVIVARIEGDKKGKEPFAELLPESTKRILTAAMLVYLKKLFDSLPIAEEESNESLLLADLKIFKKLLQNLGSKDQSKQPKFAQQLSSLWHKLTKNFNSNDRAQLKWPKTVQKMKKILEQINHYPSNEEHSFGYYLKEHVGEEWLPFPYMEILTRLHKEHLRKPHESVIAKWTDMLETIIDLFEEENS